MSSKILNNYSLRSTHLFAKFDDLNNTFIWIILNYLFKIFFLGVFIFYLGINSANSAVNTDSLKQELKGAHNTSLKVALLVKLAGNFLNVEPDSAIFFANEARVLSKTSGYQKQMGDIYGILGDVYVMQDSLILAEKYYDTCLFFQEEENNFFGVTGVLTVLGNINVVLDNTSEALQYYLRAMKLSQENNIMGRLPYLYLNIGTIQFNSDNFIEAQNYYARALDGFEKVNDSLNAARVLSSLGSTYSELNNYELAREYFNRAYLIFQKLNSAADIANCFHGIAATERMEGNHIKAIEFLKKSKDYIAKIDYSFAGPRLNILSETEVELGINYYFLKDLKNARKYLKEGYKIATANGFLSDTKNAAEYLSLLYEEKGAFDSALYFHRVFKEISESLINIENVKKLANIEAQNKYEQQEVEQQIKRQEERQAQSRKSTFLIVVIIILFLLTAVLILLLKLGRNRVKRIRLERLSLQKELDVRNKELTTHVLYQLKKNELILDISKQLSNSVSKLQPENKKVIEQIIRQLDLDTREETWEDFEIRFQQVHTGFYKSLTEHFPDLTSNELRLCAFLKLNMNSKDISAITYQSVNSIDVARSRLRQKMGLSKNENLSAFLARF